MYPVHLERLSKEEIILQVCEAKTAGPQKAACIAILDNRFVEQIDFEQNALEYVPIYAIGDVIAHSASLKHVRITSNGLKSEGAGIVCNAVQENKRIVSLDLSDNGLDGKLFEKLLNTSTSLKELYLSKNNLIDVGAQALARGMECLPTLHVLDLSWNHIRLTGAIAIGSALAKNRSLKVLNLEWNGLHLEGAKSISIALSKKQNTRGFGFNLQQTGRTFNINYTVRHRNQ
ncbi:hypothetical protein DPMN_001469 [Dreissena polymorpha]|uniref:Uncharacterized protein n=1 Tax=Dreissena polymorpha TaxID=45954 RepID=A0A9D4MKD0_DREPO|nr:hypothetical protein DPMN_001469 [Dreissena polymorpha]